MTPGGLVEVRVSWPGHPRYLKKKKKMKNESKKFWEAAHMNEFPPAF